MTRCQDFAVYVLSDGYILNGVFYLCCGTKFFRYLAIIIIHYQLFNLYIIAYQSIPKSGNAKRWCANLTNATAITRRR